MGVNSLFYDLIYQENVNYLLRNGSYPFKFLLGDSQKIPPTGKMTVNTLHGPIQLATNQTSYLTKILFWEGYNNFEYSTIFESLATKTNVFFDIGANIGYYSLLLAKANPKSISFAFEPASGPKHYLEQNIAINNFSDHIKLIDLALSDYVGEIDFYEVKNDKYPSLIYNLSGEHNAGTKKKSRDFVKNTVQATTLGNFIESNSIDKIDLIKIDTEGTEVAILGSAKDYLEKFQPIVICETLFNTTEEGLERLFDSLHYDFYNHTNTGLQKVKSIRRGTDNNIRNCFFVPKSKTHLISQFISVH